MSKIRWFYSQKKLGLIDGEPDPVSIIETILRLREQRSGMVQTKEQLAFCYNALYYDFQVVQTEIRENKKVTVKDMETKNTSNIRAARKGVKK